MAFIDLMKQESNSQKSLTENGAIAYETSGKALLDFNFEITALRNAPENKIIQMFSKAYYEDPEAAILFLFYLRDCRGGLGEKRIFKVCFKWVVNNPWRTGLKRGFNLYSVADLPTVREFVRELVPEYGSWKDVVDFAVDEEECMSQLVSIMAIDREISKVFFDPAKTSLLAKWLPSVNASSPKTRHKAYRLINDMDWNRYNYQEVVRDMRKRLNTVESQISANKWDEVNYAAVPSKANLKYSTAFLRHDKMRRTLYLSDVSDGKEKIHAGTLQPYEIVRNYGRNGYDETLEQLWKALPVLSLDNTLVVRDGSFSMLSPIGSGVSCLDVATALTILMAENNTGEWKDKFITFSSRPRIIDMSNCKSLLDKLTCCYGQNEVANTDIAKTMRLILKTAVNNNLSQADMPAQIVICSDMQFDGNQFVWDKSLFEEISEEFETFGYKLPKMIFWNINGNTRGTVPMQNNDNGLILCSGFSQAVMNMFTSGECDPYQCLLDVLYSERYAPVLEFYKMLEFQ